MKKSISIRIHHDTLTHSQVSASKETFETLLNWAKTFSEDYEGNQPYLEMNEDGKKAVDLIKKFERFMELV